MSLLYRIKRLIKADAHAFVEGLEEPQWILAQAIRDMEAELEQLAARIAERKTHDDQLAKQEVCDQQVIDKCEADIGLALSEKREDIARHLIKRQIVAKKKVAQAAEIRFSLAKELARLEAELAEKRQAYDDVCAQSQNVQFSSVRDDAFDSAKQLLTGDTNLEHEVDLELIRRLKNKKGVQHVQ